MNSFLVNIRRIFLLLLIVAGTLSCTKDNRKHKLTVVVTAQNDVRVANALVRLYVPVENSYIDWYDYTNEEGEVEYSFENTVVVEIVASKGSFIGCSFVEVGPGDNLREVDVKPFGSEDNGCSNTP